MMIKSIIQLLSKLQLSRGYLWIKYDYDLRPTITVFNSEMDNFDGHPRDTSDLGYFGYFFFRDEENGRILRAEYMVYLDSNETHFKILEASEEESRWFLDLARYQKRIGYGKLRRLLEKKDFKLEDLI